MGTTKVSSTDEARALLQRRSGPVVVVPIYNAYRHLSRCLDALSRHTPTASDLLLIDDGSTDSRVESLLGEQLRSPLQITLLSREQNQGFVKTANQAFRAVGRRDVVIVNSDVIVGPEWLDRLRDAAYSDLRIATATALTNHGTILSVPYRNRPSELPEGLTPTDAAQRIADGCPKLYPRIPAAIGHCMYIKRMALDLVGSFDKEFSPGYGEEVDFCQRCHLLGLAHICADDVFVYHHGEASFSRGPERDRLRETHERLIARRYPYYHPWVQREEIDQNGVLATALGVARRSLMGLTIVVDATLFCEPLVGTERYTLEMIRALARHSRCRRVVVLLAHQAPPSIQQMFVPSEKLKVLREGQPLGEIEVDVVYRPRQINTVRELIRLRSLGGRLVIAQLDFIAFNNAGYFSSSRAWEEYRRVTRLALASADGIAFNSRHVQQEARSAGVVVPEKPAEVIYNGTDHFRPAPLTQAPAALPSHVTHQGYILCIGVDFRHKNRRFALQTFLQMCKKGYRGALVLVGPQAEFGSSRLEDQDYLSRHPELAGRVWDLGEVAEAEKEWVYRHSSLVLYPSLCEGFGLVPFEASAAGVPYLSSAMGSLLEVLPGGIEVIEQWDPETVSDQAIALIQDGDRGAALVEALNRRAAEFTWEGVADRLLLLFDRVTQSTGSGVLALEAEGGGVLATVRRPLAERIMLELEAVVHAAGWSIGEGVRRLRRFLLGRNKRNEEKNERRKEP